MIEIPILEREGLEIIIPQLALILLGVDTQKKEIIVDLEKILMDLLMVSCG